MKKILFVDDEKDLLVAVTAFFKRHGYDVVVTVSWEDAFVILDTFTPDLIFLEVNIGSHDGRTLCKKIKAHPTYQHIPVILISSNHEALNSYQECGANAILKKPFQLSMLLNILQNHL